MNADIGQLFTDYNEALAEYESVKTRVDEHHRKLNECSFSHGLRNDYKRLQRVTSAFSWKAFQADLADILATEARIAELENQLREAGMERLISKSYKY